MGESLAGKERRLIKIENLKHQPEEPLLSILLAGEDFVCYYGLPLIAKGKVKGVLEVFHRTPLHPYPEWLEFLTHWPNKRQLPLMMQPCLKIFKPQTLN